jgi:2-methylcitrate dehydratase
VARVFQGSYGFFKVMERKPLEPVRLGEPFGIRCAFMENLPQAASLIGATRA